MVTSIRAVGRPAELRAQLFQSALVVRTLRPMSDPTRVFGGVDAVEAWHSEKPGSYLLTVADPRVAAPEVTSPAAPNAL